VLGLLLASGTSIWAQIFLLPTANHALFEPGGEDRFFAPTVGKPWITGTFGCVRTEGWQFHEGIDIRCLQRDRRGEPADSVLAAADGTVAYLNRRPSLSNYGNYLILRHVVEGIEVYSLYAHLAGVRADLKPGNPVKAGEPVGVMGRTANTRERIAKDRAHLHFELNLLLNDRFSSWFKKNHPGERNDHGDWNGRNLTGLDPRAIFLAQQTEGETFRLVRFVQQQPELCRVFVQATNFPWLRRYAPLVRPSSRAELEGVAGYEIALAFNGLPVELIPRAASEMSLKGKTRFKLLSVDAAEKRRNPCGRIVVEKGKGWELTERGQDLLGLLTF
jgi:peptidoglycan LD-endopeptidase LytH